MIGRRVRIAEGTLGAALEREHREIDQAIESYISGSTAGENPVEPLVVAIRALRRHIYLEEAFLFPPLRDAGLMAPVFVMLREHGQMWKTMDALDSTVRSGTSHASVLDSCYALAGQLRAHNPKEEQILYPLADTALTASANAALEAFIASGQTPEGWVCEGAEH